MVSEVFNSAIVCDSLFEVSICTYCLSKIRGSYHYRLSEGAYKAVLSSLGLACATRSDYNKKFKSFTLPNERFINSAIVC